MLKKIKPKEARLLIAISTLIVLVVFTASTPTGGGFSCCGKLEPDIAVTFVNNYGANASAIDTLVSIVTSDPVPNIAVAVVDPSPKDAQARKDIPLVFGQSKTETFRAGTYIYIAVELDYKIESLLPPKLTKKPGKFIDSGFFIADDTIVIGGK